MSAYRQILPSPRRAQIRAFADEHVAIFDVRPSDAVEHPVGVAERSLVEARVRALLGAEGLIHPGDVAPRPSVVVRGDEPGLRPAIIADCIDDAVHHHHISTGCGEGFALRREWEGGRTLVRPPEILASEHLHVRYGLRLAFEEAAEQLAVGNSEQLGVARVLAVGAVDFYGAAPRAATVVACYLQDAAVEAGVFAPRTVGEDDPAAVCVAGYGREGEMAVADDDFR